MRITFLFFFALRLFLALPFFLALHGCDSLKTAMQIKELSPADAMVLAGTSFDSGARVTVRGRVSTLFFGPPGSTGMMIVHTADGTQPYAFSTAPARELAGQGFSRFSMSPGEEVVVTGVLASGGTRVGRFAAARADSISKADGTRVYERSSN